MYKIKSNKWYGKFWPPERKRIKIMQAIMNHQIQMKVDSFIYGIEYKPNDNWQKSEKEK